MMMESIALPTGPYDWHPERIPQSVFEARVDAVRAIMRARDVTHLVVHGNGFDHGALAWLTGFTPKLGPGYALIPVTGAARMLFAGGPGMRPSAARLTWVEDVAALKGIGADLGRWLGDDGKSVLACVEGRAMSRGDWLAVTRAAPGGRATGLDDAIDALRRAKAPLELELIRRSAAILTTACETLSAAVARDGIRTAVLAAERRAYDAGAQDVRVRIGPRAWALPVPLGAQDGLVDGPARVAIALRASGYWVSAEFVAGALPAEVERRARDAIAGVLGRLRAGAGATDLAGVHLTCTGIGLAPEEAPRLADGDRLAEGDVCVATLTLAVAPGQTGVWSVMAAIGGDGAQLMWAPPGLGL